MATASSRSSKPNPHDAVSNQPEEASVAIKKPVSKPPAEGMDPKTIKPRADGAEAVTGFALTKEMASAVNQGYTAPDTSKLRDIAEASFGPPPQVETVHGPGNRVRITNISAYPWRAQASRLMTAADNSATRPARRALVSTKSRAAPTRSARPPPRSRSAPAGPRPSCAWAIPERRGRTARPWVVGPSRYRPTRSTRRVRFDAQHRVALLPA